MANTLKIKRSSISGKVPLTTDLQLGELAVNTYDGKLFLKKDVGGVESIVDVSAGIDANSILTLLKTVDGSGSGLDADLVEGMHAVSTNTVNSIVARDASGNFSAGTITAALSGNASTTTKLATARTISITGDVTGSVSFDGSADASITATIAANSVALGTDTTGNYVASVATTAPLSGGTTGSEGTAISLSLASGYGDTQNPYASKTANTFLAAPNGSAGTPTFRTIVAADIPTLNQNTTGTASNVTGTVAIANGGTGATTAANARINLSAAEASQQWGSGYDFNNTKPAYPTLHRIVWNTGDSNIVNGPAGNTTGVLLASQGSHALWNAQMFFKQGADTAMYIRGSSDSSGVISWGNWKTILDSTNYNNYSPTLTGTGASGSWNINASTVTNGVYTTGSYADPAWITSINYSKLTGTIPTWNQNTTGSAAKWTTARTLSFTGDATGSGSVDGSANVATALTLANSGVTAGTYTKITVDAKGRATSGTTLAATDIPALDASKITSGVFDAARLPSYVDDVLEYTNLASFPTTGETGKIYVDLATNKTYRWSGTVYVYITSGAVDSVAGKTGVVMLTNSDVGLGNVENKSSATIRSELTSTNVTTALGYTPYSSTNPNGYTTNTGTVTSITAGTGLSGGTITTSGTISLANTAVTAGSYTLASITVDAQGRITAASNGSASASISDAPPTAVNGTLWWDSRIGRLFVYYNDGTTSQWVDASPGTGPVGPQGPQGPQGATGPQGPQGLTGGINGGTLTGQLIGATLSMSMSQDGGANNGSFVVRASGTGDANLAGITFHNDSYAIKLGVRADGAFGLGGWSRAAWSWYSDSSGNMVAAGNVTAYSDPRLKENFKKVEKPLDILSKLDGGTFTWKHGYQHTECKAGKQDYGILADQVELVMPEIVTESIEIDGEKYKTVAYEKLIPVLIEAIKQQQKQIDSLMEMLND